MQETPTPVCGVTSSKFENRKLLDFAIPSCRSNSVPRDQDEMCVHNNGSNKRLQMENESVPRMWHLLADKHILYLDIYINSDATTSVFPL